MQLPSPLPRFASLLLLVLPVCSVTPATLAQTTKVFVASTGSDTNDGSRTTPKRNFQAAHDTVTAGGQIIALDTAGYGTVTITKSVFITVPPGVNGFITTSLGNTGITINATATDVVSLRGLIIEGGGTTGAGAGIDVASVGTLRVENCLVRSFPRGINMHTASSSSLLAQGSNLRDCQGIVLDYNSSSGTMNGAVIGCTMDTSASSGLVARNRVAGGSVVLVAKNCKLTRHASGALRADGAGAQILADNCVLSYNSAGINILNAGSVISLGNNTFTQNDNDSAFTGTLAAK